MYAYVYDKYMTPIHNGLAEYHMRSDFDILHEQSAIDPGGEDLHGALRPGTCWPNQKYIRMTLYLAPCRGYTSRPGHPHP